MGTIARNLLWARMNGSKLKLFEIHELAHEHTAISSRRMALLWQFVTLFNINGKRRDVFYHDLLQDAVLHIQIAIESINCKLQRWSQILALQSKYMQYTDCYHILSLGNQNVTAFAEAYFCLCQTRFEYIILVAISTIDFDSLKVNSVVKRWLLTEYHDCWNSDSEVDEKKYRHKVNLKCHNQVSVNGAYQTYQTKSVQDDEHRDYGAFDSLEEDQCLFGVADGKYNKSYVSNYQASTGKPFDMANNWMTTHSHYRKWWIFCQQISLRF